MRPLYEQDAIDVLAAPAGSIYRFRYDGGYVGSGLNDLWRSGGLVGRSVLVVFSIQQQAGYHAAFIPVRLGTVVSTSAEGSLFVVNFEIGPYVSLPRPKEDAEMGNRVLAFSDEIRKCLRESPDAKDFKSKRSAVLGVSMPDLEISSERDIQTIWEHSVDYLSRTLSFREHVFVRFAGLHPSSKPEHVPFKDGMATLTAGRTYELYLTHRQPHETLGVKGYEVLTDGEILRVVGLSNFSISSRYDRLPIALHVPDRDSQRGTILVIKPAAGVSGANIRVSCKVVPSKPRRAFGAFLTALSLLLVSLPGVLGATVTSGSKLVLAATGFLMGGVLVYNRLGQKL